MIAKPLFLAMHWVNDNFVHNYGWSIVLITIAINLVLLPLRLKSMKSQRKMQSLQPKLAAINAKYKGLSMRDPKKAEQNQEVMEFYKKDGVNPMGGCLPMLVQLPLIYAFYKVLAVTIEMRGAHWLWISRSVAAGAAAHPYSAAHHDRVAVRHAEDDAQPGHGSFAGENDDVHAADVRVLVLQFFGWPGVILANQ